MVKVAEGEDFDSLFRSALTYRAVRTTAEMTITAGAQKPDTPVGPDDKELDPAGVVASEAEVHPSPPEPHRDRAEPQPGTLEELRQRISRMADTNDIGPAVREYLDHLFEPLREGGLVLKVQVSACREGRERIDLGDWVESLGSGNTDKQIGRVVGRDKLRRPVMRWFEAGAWQKARSLFNNSYVSAHVLSAAETRAKYPHAFDCYRPVEERQSGEKSDGGP